MKFRYFSDAYKPIVEHCLTKGKQWHPRGFDCCELRPFTFTIENPWMLYCGKSRHLNYRFWVVETLGYISGIEDEWYVDLLTSVNSRMKSYINPVTGKFDGMYGPRLRESLPQVIELLRKDPSSRQAVASIWKPGIPENSLDVPCTVCLHFINTGTLESPELGLSVYMRSNDLNWGAPYDVMAFNYIQGTVASCLGWRVGTYTHTCGSLHVYMDQFPDLSNERCDWFPIEMRMQFPEYSDFREVRSDAIGFLDELANTPKDKWKSFGKNGGTVYNWFRDLVRFGRG